MDHLSNGTLKMSDSHLTKYFVDSVGCTDAKPVSTPSSGPLFQHCDLKEFDHSFNYCSAIGMFQYLGQNTRPNCSHAINACSRHCVDPHEPHAQAIITHHVKDSLNEGINLKPNLNNLVLHCHVDAEYARAWNLNDSKEPSGVKLLTGFILTFAGTPILWKSKPWDCIALSTMEAEYIALSTAMRSLIHVHALLLDISLKCNLTYGNKISTMSAVFEDNCAAKILATTDPPRLMPCSESLAVKYH